MSHWVAVVFGVLGGTANLLWVWPQAITLRRTAERGAVSLSTWMLALLVAATVLRTGLVTGIPMVLTGLSQLIGVALLLASGVKAGWSRQWVALGAVAMVILSLALPWWNDQLVFVLDLAIPIPQLVRVIRKRSALGVSLPTWILAASQGLFWSMNLALTDFEPWTAAAQMLVTLSLVAVILQQRKDTQVTV